MSLSGKVRTQIAQFLDQAQHGHLVSAVDALLDYLQEQGLLHWQQIPGTFIRCHPHKRDGVGCSGIHCHDLLDDLLDIGWVDKEARGVCVEIPSSQLDAVQSFNVALSKNSSGKLAPWEEAHKLKYATIWASHTNQVLRLWLHSMPHSSQQSTVCHGGCLSLAKLRLKDPQFAKAVEEGMRWRVISSLVPEAFPEVTKLVQSAGNCVGSVMRCESELQLCCKVLQAISEVRTRTGADVVSFDSIKGQILRSKPRCAAAAPFLFKFCLKFGGDSCGHLVLETERYVKGHGYATRSLGADVWDALSTECKGGSRVLLRHCLLKLAFTHASDKFLTVSDVKRALSPGLATRAEEAEDVLRQVQDLADSVQINDEHRLTILGQLQCNLAVVVLDKAKHKGMKDTGARLISTADAGHVAVEQLNQHVSDGRALASPWASSISASAASSHVDPPPPTATGGAGQLEVNREV